MADVGVCRLMKKFDNSDNVGGMLAYIHYRLKELLPPNIIKKLTQTSDSCSDATKSVPR